MENRSIHLSILDNSHAFFIEAIEKVVIAQEETRNWQFAVLHLIQSLELTLKEALRKIHPVFIYDDIEKRTNTITISKALSRIQDPAIGNIQFTEHQKSGIKSAIHIRNAFVHSELHLTPQHAEANFFIVFELLVEIQKTILGYDIREIVPDELLAKIIEIEQTKKLLVKQANDIIDKIPANSIRIWDCPECLANTFFAYIDEKEGNCLTCRISTTLIRCDYCKLPYFEDELENFYNKLDTDYFEGIETIENDYGYANYSACSNCMPRILEDIEQQRADDFDYHQNLSYILPQR
jgi:hypothetical protein